MQAVRIVPVTFDMLAEEPNFGALLDEYGQESAIKGFHKPNPCAEMYRQLEAVGMLQIMAAFHDQLLVGFVSLLTSMMPHYSRVIATTESFFVTANARKHGAGLKLLKAAENYAKLKKAEAILVSSPAHGRLADVLPGLGYVHSNTVFMKVFA